MEIRPPKLIKHIDQSGIETQDLWRKPDVKASPPASTAKSSLSFTANKLFMDGKEVGQLISETAELNPQHLARLAAELEGFKELSLKRKRKFVKARRKLSESYTDAELSQIFALCDAYILRIAELIKKRYDQTKDGLKVFFDDHDQLIVNDINIQALIKQCKENPNPKSLTFLKGIHRRLALVLQNKSNSANFDHIQETVAGLMQEIDAILD